MIVAMIFASVWGLVQLGLLGSFGRTLRLRTIFLGVAVGLYACAPFALLLQLTWIHSAAWLTGTPAHVLVEVGAYSIDPFIEEIVKVLPIVVLLALPAIRRQWSITDCVLVGAALGAGFGLAENLFRFGAVSSLASWQAHYGGWMLLMLPDSTSPVVPSPWTTLTSWLPPGVLPNDPFTLSLNSYPALNLHLAWSAVGGLAVGLIALGQRKLKRMPWTVLLLLYIAADHAAYNAVLMGIMREPLLLRNVLAFTPIAALGVAWWFDRYSHRPTGGDEPVLLAEQNSSLRFTGTLRAAIGRIPWSVGWVSEFVRLRRADKSAAAFGFSPEQQALHTATIDARDRVERNLAAPESPRWLPWHDLLAAVRRPANVLWLVLITPAILWFVVGGWPQTAAVQAMLTGPTVWVVVILLSVLAQAWITFGVITAVRFWPRARQFSIGEDIAIVGMRIASGIGAVALGGFALLLALTGASPNRRHYIPHGVEAFSSSTPAVLLQVTSGAALLLSGLGFLGLSTAIGAGSIAAKLAGLRPEESDEAGRDLLPEGDVRRKAEWEAKAKKASERAEARYKSATRDATAAKTESRLANAARDRAHEAAARAGAERDAILASGDEANIHASRNLYIDAVTAARGADAEAARAEGAYQGAVATHAAAQADANAAMEEYAAAAESHAKAVTKMRAASAARDPDKP
jgi:RsiW-degrading membrane proteinase PrsW (M82 family)